MTDNGDVTLFFSMEYTVVDVQTVLIEALNEIVSRVIYQEFDCPNDPGCTSVDYDVTIDVFQSGKGSLHIFASIFCFSSPYSWIYAILLKVCLERPVDTAVKCGYADVIVNLKSLSPLGDLEKAVVDALKGAIRNEGIVNRLINSG